MSVPNWLNEAVFYQIFPDRFANGDPRNDPANVQPWGTLPTRRGFQGGDLAGITHKLDYLQDLGVNALYLNPIFMSPSTHRYDTSDYLKIDPKLGTMADFRQLVESAHRRGMRLILDGVFNHCSRGFFAFNDILENEEDSPYLGWFHVRKFPLRAYEPGKARNYEAWWGYKSLPKINTANPEARRYLLEVARYWIEQGADGWRLDVPNEIDDDDFWAEFRQVVYQANPQAYTLGEIWDVGPRWCNQTHFDGLMNYPMRTAILQFLNGQLTGPQFGARISHLLTVYPRENIYAMYNLLGSHDVERILTLYEGGADKVRLAMLFQFAYPGVPAVYYGDEVGLPGGKDPDCRRAFPWQEGAWNTELRAWAQRLIAARQATPALRQGDFTLLPTDDSPALCAFARTQGEQTVLVALNAGSAPAELRLPVDGLGLAEGRVLRDLLGSQECAVQAGGLVVRLQPHSGAWLA